MTFIPLKLKISEIIKNIFVKTLDAFKFLVNLIEIVIQSSRCSFSNVIINYAVYFYSKPFYFSWFN